MFLISISIIIEIIGENRKMPLPETISAAVDAYLANVQGARSEHTARTYRNALNAFCFTLQKHDLNPKHLSPTALNEATVSWFIADLHASEPVYAASSERLYLTAVTGFFEFLVIEGLETVQLTRLRRIIRDRARRPGQRLPQFPADEIEKLINNMINLINIMENSDATERLRTLRDRALIVTLADTGLRIHEACKLTRGDVDWQEGFAIVIGKGNREDVVRFSARSMQMLRDYLRARSSLDGASGQSLRSLPLFARHDKGAGKRIKAITPTTGRNIVTERVEQFLGPEAVHTITPHSFRHYFVTRVLKGSGNLKLAQELARHRNIAVTQRYAHLSNDELDRGYHEIFEDSR
jgi:site-specific recombinase XerD